LIEIHTDGANNPVLSRGGWAAVVIAGGKKRVFSGAVDKTTSNRMEITAALEGISQTPQGAEVMVYTDSQYLFGCMAKGWQRRANRDLWEKLDAVVAQRRVRWQWIERDNNNPSHQEAHALATGLTGRDKALPSAPSEAMVGDGLTHVDALGRPKMVDITGKSDTRREAVAKGRVSMKAATLNRLKQGKMPKGDVLNVARLAGIMAAKQTPHLIPLCHPLLIGDVEVELALDEEASAVSIAAMVKSTGKTGVEMEALTAAAVAALTIYDMCKAVDRGIQIENIRLARKSGGKSGTINLE